jgi:hypothetical protein
MSTPKVGDRVKVTVEGVLTETPRNEQIWLEGGLIEYTEGVLLVSVEVIEPPFVLPTKLWAQVWDKGAGTVMDAGTLWTRRYTEGDRIEGAPDGINDEWFSDDYLEISSKRLLEQLGLRVISEGVDE